VKSIISLATLAYFLADFQLPRWPNMAVVDIWRGGLLDITRHVAVNAFSAENSLPKTVINSDSVTVFKSRLKTIQDIPLLPGFLSSLLSVAHCLAPAPLKLRPYGAIQIRVLLRLLFNIGSVCSRG